MMNTNTSKEKNTHKHHNTKKIIDHANIKNIETTNTNDDENVTNDRLTVHSVNNYHKCNKTTKSASINSKILPNNRGPGIGKNNPHEGDENINYTGGNNDRNTNKRDSANSENGEGETEGTNVDGDDKSRASYATTVAETGEDGENDDDDDEDEDADDDDARSQGYKSVASVYTDDGNNEDDDLEDVNDENAFGYQYQYYLSGGPIQNAFLFLWHTLLLLVGLAFIILGVILRFYFGKLLVTYIKALPMYPTYAIFVQDPGDNPYINFSEHVPNIGIMLMVLHAIYCLCLVGYMTYSSHRYQFTLPILVIVTSIVTFSEITIVNVIFAPALSARDDIKEELMGKVINDYDVQSDNEFSISYDYISIYFGCCGIVDQYDFQSRQLNWYNPDVRRKLYIAIPPTCCKREMFDSGRDSVISCAINMEDVYKHGCFTVLTDYIKTLCEYYSVVVWIHIFDCLWHAVIYKWRVSFFFRVLDWKNERIDEYMRYLLKARLKQEASEMDQLFGPGKIKRYSTISDRLSRVSIEKSKRR